MDKKAVIEKVHARPKKGIVPTILSFQNGIFNGTKQEEKQYSTLNKDNTTSKEALLVVGHQIYTGPINANQAAQLTDSYLCVRSRKTNKVRIIPVDQANLKNHVYVQLRQKQLEENASLPTMDQQLAKKKLIKEFGGRKAARVYDDSEKMHVSMDLVKDDLEVTVEETTITDETDEVQRETAFEYICPKHNKDAKQITEIYNIDDLVPTSLLDRLNEEAKAVHTSPIVNLPIKSEFLLSCIEKLRDGELSESECFQKIKVIIFMDSLFNLLTSSVRNLSKAELSGITEKVETYIRGTFANHLRSSNAKLKDKAMCYYIALCLLIDKKNSIDTSILAKEFRKPKKSILQYARMVNALPVSAQSDVATLRLPSKVAPLKTKSFKKKKIQ